MHHMYFKSPLEPFGFIMLSEPRWIFNTSTISKVSTEIQLAHLELPGPYKCSGHSLQTPHNDSYLASSAGPSWINISYKSFFTAAKQYNH